MTTKLLILDYFIGGKKLPVWIFCTLWGGLLPEARGEDYEEQDFANSVSHGYFQFFSANAMMCPSMSAK